MVLAAVALLVMLNSISSVATAEGPEQATAAVSFANLASKADLVAVVQVKDTDYVYTRSFPSEGSAYLKILIAYKHNQANEQIIEVHEQGLHPNECYFVNPTVLEEGRRYLAFFRHDSDEAEVYRGLAEGCAHEILVTKDNRYVLKYPLTGIEISDTLAELVRKFDFQDKYALITEERLSPSTRDSLLAKGLIIPYLDRFKYTQGVELSDIRKLIGSEALNSSQTRAK